MFSTNAENRINDVSYRHQYSPYVIRVLLNSVTMNKNKHHVEHSGRRGHKGASENIYNTYTNCDIQEGLLKNGIMCHVEKKKKSYHVDDLLKTRLFVINVPCCKNSMWNSGFARFIRFSI